MDGGFKMNFPIETLYKKAKSEDRILIGIRFKNPQSYLNPLNSRQVFRRILKFVISSGNQIPKDITEYPYYVDIEIDASGFNPLNFKMGDLQKQKLFEQGQYVARIQLEALLRKLREIRSGLRSQLPPNVQVIVDEAQGWLDNEARQNVRRYCEDVLDRNNFYTLKSGIDEKQTENLCREIYIYLGRVSESLLDQDYDLLKDRLKRPSIPNLELYCEILGKIKTEIPRYINQATKEEIEKRIDFLQKSLVEQFFPF